MREEDVREIMAQPPSGGCELKRVAAWLDRYSRCQPPSGGCELKLAFTVAAAYISFPAAFGRL